MAGSISSLGLGSGTLTSDVIDKLKAADKKATVTPIETKIKENDTRTSDLNTLRDMANKLKSLSSNLAGGISYLERDTSVTGDSASVVAETGTSTQSFTLDVTQMAQKQIMQSTDSFNDKNAKVGEGTLTIGGKDIAITNDMGLQDIKDAIFDQTGGKVIASVLNVGKDDTGKDQFKMVLRSSEDGKAGEFSVSGDMASALKLVDDGENKTKIQDAQDAIFKYNGVEISRSSNEVKDLIPGVTIKINETGKTSVDIAQKTSNVVEDVEKFVNQYNELVQNLSTVTGFDSEKKVKGTFQGNSEMNALFRNLKDSVITTNGSMADFGLDLNRDGTLSLDKAKLENKAKTDFDSVANFFKGDDKEVGMFKSVDNALADITSRKESGMFTLIETNLKTNGTRLQKNLTSAQTSLDSKYEIMQKQFAAYDAMIAKMNASFSSMKLMIEQSVASN